MRAILATPLDGEGAQGWALWRRRRPRQPSRRGARAAGGCLYRLFHGCRWARGAVPPSALRRYRAIRWSAISRDTQARRARRILDARGKAPRRRMRRPMRSIGAVRVRGDTTTSRMCIVMIRKDCVVEEDLPPRFGRLMKMISTRGKNALQIENFIKAAETG